MSTDDAAADNSIAPLTATQLALEYAPPHLIMDFGAWDAARRASTDTLIRVCPPAA